MRPFQIAELSQTAPPSWSTWFRIFKKLTYLVTPLGLRGWLMALQAIGKEVIIARNGEDTLRKYTTFSALETLLFIILFESLGPVVPLVARKLVQVGIKENSPEQVGTSLRAGLAFSAVLSLVCSTGCFLAPNIFALTGQSEDVIIESRAYFLWWLLPCFFDTAFRVLVRFMIAKQKTKSTVVADAGEGVIDLALTELFVNQLGYGVQGSVMAYGTASFCTVFGYGFYLHRRADCQEYQLFHTVYFSIEELKDLATHGVQSATTSLFDYSARSLVMLYVGEYEPSPLAALAPAIGYSTLVGFPVGTAAEIPAGLIAESIENKNDDYRLIGHVAITMGVLYIVLTALFIVLIAKPFIDLFFNDAADRNDRDYNLAFVFLWLECTKQLITGTMYVTNMALLGSAITRFPACMSFASLFVLNVTMASLARFVFKMDPVAVIASQIPGYFLAMLSSLWRWDKIDEKDLIVARKEVAPVSLLQSCGSFFKSTWAVMSYRSTVFANVDSVSQNHSIPSNR